MYLLDDLKQNVENCFILQFLSKRIQKYTYPPLLDHMKVHRCLAGVVLLLITIFINRLLLVFIYFISLYIFYVIVLINLAAALL